MIGVLVKPSDIPVVEEFFELFKTQWEFYRPGRLYDVLVCGGCDEFPENSARLVVIYSGHQTAFDTREQIQSVRSERFLAYKNTRVPIYGDNVSLSSSGDGKVSHDEHGPILTLRVGESIVARVGYDLFSEIRALLTTGQPSWAATVPTLEIHIALL